VAESRSSSKRGSNGGLSAKEAIQRVRRELPQLLGHPVESVLGVQRNDDNLWEVTVQVVELVRVPNSTDVLGAYEVTLDEDGELAGYRRRRRYTRGQADDD
jgi:hypothetical protein